MLEVGDQYAPFIIELLESLKYIHIVNEIKNPKKAKIIHDLEEAFSNVKLYIQGKKKLKTAKDLLNEL